MHFGVLQAKIKAKIKSGRHCMSSSADYSTEGTCLLMQGLGEPVHKQSVNSFEEISHYLNSSTFLRGRSGAEPERSGAVACNLAPSLLLE